MLDNNKNVWEVTKRTELNLNSLNNNIENIQSLLIKNNEENKLINIENQRSF